MISSTLSHALSTGPATAFLVLAGLAMLVDWIAVVDRNGPLAAAELVAKPAVPLALLGLVAVASSSHGAARWLVMVALLFCTIGDVALMLPDGKSSLFIVGLGAFLIAQVLFAIAFATLPHGSELVALALVLLVAALPTALVLKAVSSTQRELLGPVIAYVIAILAMATTAVAVGIGGGLWVWVAAVGGLAFIASDLLLAINRFIRPLPREALLVHVTYHIGIVGLALGLLAAT